MWRLVVALLLAAAVAGCGSLSSLSTETRSEEIFWQSVHLLDSAQTYSIARDPDCYRETVVDPLIGRHPTPAAVIGWSIAFAGLHWVVTSLLAEHPTEERLWQALTVGSTSYWVWHNTRIGIRPFGHNEPQDGACRDMPPTPSPSPVAPPPARPPPPLRQ